MGPAQYAKLKHSVTEARDSVRILEEMMARENLPTDKANNEQLLTYLKSLAQYHENKLELYKLTCEGGGIDRLKQQAEHPLPRPIPLGRGRTTMLRPGKPPRSRLLSTTSVVSPTASIVRALEQAEARKAKLEEEIARFEREEPEWLKTIEPAIAWFREKYAPEGDNQPPSPKKRVEQFRRLAGQLWRKAPRTGKRVSREGLAWIAAELDKTGFVPITDFLEEYYSDEVKAYNTRNENSKDKSPIYTWSALVASRDKTNKNLVLGMRRVLYRCK